MPRLPRPTSVPRPPPAVPDPARRQWVGGAAAAMAGLCLPTAHATEPARPDRAPAPAPGRGALTVMGYYPWWMQDHWRSRALQAFRRIGFFEVSIQEDGGILRNGWPGRWQALQRAAGAAGAKVDVTLTLFDLGVFQRLFSDRGRRAGLLAVVGDIARRADGIHLDVEIFDTPSTAAVSGYRAFCAELRETLDAASPRKELSAFCVMGAAVDLLDRRSLELMDFVVVQGYDSHHARSRQTGPVAPLRGPYAITWETAVAHYGRLGVPASRMLLSFPFYGYEWTAASGDPGARVLAAGRTGTFADVDPALLPDVRLNLSATAARHGLRRDPHSGSPYYAYRDGGDTWRQGWFEDETSLAAKLAWLRDHGLAGIAVFPIGYDAGRLETQLQRALSAARS